MAGQQAARGKGSAAAKASDADDGDDDFGKPGPPLSNRSPFVIGFFGGLGLLVAYWFYGLFLMVGPVLLLIVVAMFLAVGLNPAVEFFMRRGLARSWAVVVVITFVVIAVALFMVAIVPVVTDQVASLTKNAPGWLDQLQHSKTVERLDQKYDVISKLKSYVTDGGLGKQVFGGVLGVGLKILGFLANAFVVFVMMLYFLATLPRVKTTMFRFAPASRRDRVTKLGNQILEGIGAYVSGAFIVALCAGVTSLIFLFIVGLGEYAVALALVVALLDVIPMIGATIGATIVCAIGFATDVQTGIALVIFYVIYQQLENYFIYPRVMSHTVDLPGLLTVIAALIGASLLGVIGALLAIPTAAALVLLSKEIVIRRQDAR